MAEVNREWLFKELRCSLSLLAADGATALAGLPDGCCKPDELALDFDNFRVAVVDNFAAELPPELVSALKAVDAAFDPINGEGWSEEAVRSAPEWTAVRERAGVALALLDRFESQAEPAVAPEFVVRRRRASAVADVEVPIAEVVELLADRWRARCRDLEDHMRSTFGVPAPRSIPTRLHLSQMADGTIHPENIGHDFAAVWLVEAGGVRPVPLNFEWQARWDTDESDTYYLMHSYSFVSQGGELLLSERYGPRLKHRSRGRLLLGPPLTAEWATCWQSGPERSHGEPNAAADGGDM